MMEKLVYFIRHGESTANFANINGGQVDTPLTDTGRAQAAASKAQLDGITFDTVFCSDLLRAKETAAIMLPDADYRYTDAIREIDVGTLGGTKRIECLEKYGEIFEKAHLMHDFSPFGGESPEEFVTRVEQFMQMLAEGDFGERIAVFCHGGVIQRAAYLVMGMPFAENRLAVSNCSVSVFGYEDGIWKIRTFNRTPTLPR